MSQSQHLHSIPDDPRLTAYVLDELSAEERAEVDRLIAASPEVRAAVDEIRETVGELNAAYDIDALRELEHSELNSAAVVGSDTKTFTAVADTTHSRQRLSRRAVLSLAGTVVAASLLVVIMATDRVNRPTGARAPENEKRNRIVASDTQSRLTEIRSKQEILNWSAPVTDINRTEVESLRGLTDGLQSTQTSPSAQPVAPVTNLSSVVRGPGASLPSHTVRNGAPVGTPAPIALKQRDGGSTTSFGVPVTPVPAPSNAPVLSFSTGTTPLPAIASQESAPVAGRPSVQSSRMSLQTPRIAIDGTEEKLSEGFSVANSDGIVAIDRYSKQFGDEKGRGYLPYRHWGWAAVPMSPDGEPQASFYYTPSAPQGELGLVPSQKSAEAYAPIVENDFLLPTAAPLSTFGVDVDSASYSNMRRFLTQNQLPPANAIRIEELLNYFKYNDPAPQGDKPFSVGLEAATCPWNQDHILVRVGLKGKEIHRKERPASNLVFLVDVSGSMSNENKLPLVKSGLELLVGELSETDRVAIVTYAGNAGVALESTSGQEKSKILQMIQGLNAGGSTNGEGGLRLAYEQATKNFVKGGSNRVILCTDGDFNVGVSGDDELVQIIGQQAKSGVYLSVLGFGMGNLKDEKLEKIADKGNGHYGYVDSIREAQKLFVEEMTGTLYTIAKDVKVQVEFNPGRVGAYRLVGYENRVMPAEDFRNDAKDSGDIGAGHSVTALYEIIPVGKLPNKKPLKYQPTADASAPAVQSNSPELLTLSLRYKRPSNEPVKPAAPGVTTQVESAEKSVQEDYPLAAPSDASAKTSDDFRWTSAVAAFGMLLRNSAHKGNADFRMVTDLANSSVGGTGGPNDWNYQTAEYGRRREFITLVEAAKRLRGEQPSNNTDDSPRR